MRNQPDNLDTYNEKYLDYADVTAYAVDVLTEEVSNAYMAFR